MPHICIIYIRDTERGREREKLSKSRRGPPLCVEETSEMLGLSAFYVRKGAPSCLPPTPFYREADDLHQI